MSYKYQQDILSTLHEDVERHIENKNYIRKGQQDLADMHRCDTKRLASELNEVYAKAKAFDEIEQVIDENTGLGEGDEDLVNYENLLDEIEIITNYVEREAE